MDHAIVLDCDEGRRLGCASFCCRLIVRLQPGERDPSKPHDPNKRCVDKDPKSGLCACFDPQTSRCTAWDERPRVCREYDCNGDDRLQIVLREGFHGLVHLGRRAAELARTDAGASVPRVPRKDG